MKISIYNPKQADLDKLYGPFKKGLFDKYNLNTKDLIDRGYHFCGGDKEWQHKVRWNRLMGNIPRPKRTNICICGVKIVYNAYVIDRNRDLSTLIIIGYCCKDHFIPKIEVECPNTKCTNLTGNINLCDDCIKVYCSRCFDKFRLKSKTKCGLCKECDDEMKTKTKARCNDIYYTKVNDMVKDQRYILDEKGKEVGT